MTELHYLTIAEASAKIRAKSLSPVELAKAYFARIAALNEAAAMLHWDASAMMPAGGGAARGPVARAPCPRPDATPSRTAERQ